MKKFQNLSLFMLRVSMGWLMFYAGITKIINPNWSAADYLGGAKTFSGFYNWFLRPDILPTTNFINEWALTLLGIFLILGFFVKISSIGGLVLMFLYYFPVLDFPNILPHSFIVDEHIIYAFVLLFFAASGVGKVWGVDKFIFSKSSRWGAWLG